MLQLFYNSYCTANGPIGRWRPDGPFGRWAVGQMGRWVDGPIRLFASGTAMSHTVLVIVDPS